MRLRDYPFVIVRFACHDCPRAGRYRLAVLAERYGASTDMMEVLEAVSASCGRWFEGHPGRRCRAYLVDLPPDRPPDLPRDARLGKFKVVEGGKAENQETALEMLQRTPILPRRLRKPKDR